MNIPSSRTSSIPPPQPHRQRQVWSSLSMAVEHISRPSTPIVASSSSKSDLSLPPPTYEVSQSTTAELSSDRVVGDHGSIARSLMSECRVRTWKFEIAFEGGARVSDSPPSSAPSRAPSLPFGSQLVFCLRTTFGIVAAAVVGIGGMILSVSIVLLAYVVPSINSKPPPKQIISKPRPVRTSSQHSSVDSVDSAATTLAASVESHVPSIPPPHQQDDASSKRSTVVTLPPGPERRVTFQLQAHPTGGSDVTTASGLLSINTPVVAEFAERVPTPEPSEKDSSSILCRKESNSSRGGSSFVNKFIKRRSATTALESCSSDLEVLTASPGTSAPSTPNLGTSSLPAVAEKSLVAAIAAEETKRSRRLSLNLKLRGFKRRSATPQPSPSPSVLVATAPPVIESILVSPASTATANSVPATAPANVDEFGLTLDQTATTTTPSRKKRFSLPHNAPSTSPVSHPHVRPGQMTSPQHASLPQPTDKAGKRASYEGHAASKSSSLDRRRASMDVQQNPPPAAFFSTSSGFKKSKSSSSSKAPVAYNPPRMPPLDRHTRMQQAASAYYSDSEVASPGSSPTRMRF